MVRRTLIRLVAIVVLVSGALAASAFGSPAQAELCVRVRMLDPFNDFRVCFPMDK
jgi:hypothetical protein